MNNFIDDDDGNIYIDPEEWLQVLLAITADDEQKQQLLENISQSNGVPLDKVEEISGLFIQTLLEVARSN